jgi:hypothetical protein
MTDGIPLLVASCDKYADLWPSFFALFRQRWPDCPFPVFLGSNELSQTFPGVTCIPIGPDASWSTSLAKMLDKVTESNPGVTYLLLFLEDFFLTTPVDTSRVLEMVRLARARELGCLRLAAGLPLALPPSRAIPELQGVGEIASGDPYRVTLQLAIWRIETLRRLLSPGLSAWEFEMIGTHLSEQLDDAFWAVTRPAVHYAQVIEKGKWKREGLDILRGAGLDPGQLQRGVYSEEELAAHYDRALREGGSSEYRSAALRSFLAGRRLDGVGHLWRGMRQGNMLFADLLLGVVGSLGRAATKKALSVYVSLRLRSNRRRDATKTTFP